MKIWNCKLPSFCHECHLGQAEVILSKKFQHKVRISFVVFRWYDGPHTRNRNIKVVLEYSRLADECVDMRKKIPSNIQTLPKEALKMTCLISKFSHFMCIENFRNFLLSI